MLSVKVNEETVYSTPWSRVNIKAKTTVKNIPSKDPSLLPCITQWWAYVTVKPDESNRTVLRRGNSKGLTESIPLGGHWAPISTGGDKALWKKAQNILKKNNASLTMNKATPIFRPLCTAKVWFPKYVPSDIMSLNQNDIENIRESKANVSIIFTKGNPCIVSTPVQVRVNKEIEVKIGQGEGETKWNGWAWKLLLIKLVIFIYCFGNSNLLLSTVQNFTTPNVNVRLKQNLINILFLHWHYNYY